MATVQPPILPDPPAGTIAERRDYLVEFKRHWSHPWRPIAANKDTIVQLEAGELRCQSIAISAPPTMSRAQFRFHAGEIRNAGEADFTRRPGVDLRGWFVRVKLLKAPPDGQTGTTVGANGDAAGAADPNEGATEKDTSQTLFVGYFPSMVLDSRGTLVGANTHADVTYTAYGLEYLLDRDEIGTSHIDTGEETYEEIGHALDFNREYSGPAPATEDAHFRGNRGESKTITVESLNAEYVAYTFTNSNEGERWSVQEVVWNLIAFHFPRSIRWDFTVAGGEDLRAFIANWKPRAVSVDGRTPFDVLNELFERRRGLGWRIEFEEGDQGEEDEEVVADTMRIVVFTVLGAAITVGTARLPANANATDLDLKRTTPAADVGLELTDTSRFGKIIVEGERILSCATFRFGETPPTLEAGWTLAEQTAFIAGITTPPVPESTDPHDAFREQPRFQNVFRAYRVPSDWDGTVNDGKSAVPHCNPATGLVGVMKTGEDGEQTDNFVPFFRRVGRRFENFIPIPEPETTAITGRAERDWLRPFVLFTDVRDRLIMGHGSQIGGFLQLLERDWGVYVGCHGAKLARNFLLIKSGIVPVAAYSSAIVTAAFRTDERLRLEINLQQSDRGNEQENEPDAIAADMTLRIRVPEAEAWHVTPGTIVGVDAANQPILHAGGLVRDDSELLRTIAATAQAWYGKPRRALTVTLTALETGYAVGTLIKKVRELPETTAAPATKEVNGVVTEVVIDLERQTTTIRTDFAELDAAGTLAMGGIYLG